ncbi:hypothetical protein Lbys_1339 [Leadbetterella byssophila DSM 17132]|uniref:Uncharacterized protein n=1 Tax=Leadbetterella byssophila (strain DSM 17132 / JCM 16389 / KACC 11308 / NBRC 106382 / 4M15) TaxID=649349 RepID=E4RVJ4_LEAB4|nr:hypothetical protein Lbys_1339 [Leadbetterella byssophila DSM 17132]
MEETGKKAFPVQRVIELYKEEGIELTTQQAEQILEFSQKLINIVISQCMTGLAPVESTTGKHHEDCISIRQGQH